MYRLALVAVAACTGSHAPDTGVPYLDDGAYRRAELEASLVDPENGYSRIRLANYGGAWDALADANPRTEPVTGDPLAPLSPAATARELAIDPEDDAALRALGEDAFFHYPAQILPAAAIAIDTGGDYGFWRDPVRGLGGLQRVELDGGAIAVAATCSTCHAALQDGALVPGLPNVRLDLGRMFVDTGAIAAEDVAAFTAWGPGRLDVTTTTGVEPVRIADLRPVAWLSYLQADATVRHLDLATLAIRIETLIIISHQQAVRPPRIVALALASYVTSLAASLPAAPDVPAVFAQRCAGCHVPPALTGEPIALDVIGTDPTLGRSPDRGTGAYRVPSLHGVAQRGQLLHDAAVGSLDALFDPARTESGYTGGVRPGPVPGHLFGLDLDAADRAALFAYLEAL